MRPLLPGCRVFHRTKAASLVAPPPWLVLAYAVPDQTASYAGVFRLTQRGEECYRFCPRGPDVARHNLVTFESTGDSVRTDGATLTYEGIVVRRDRVLSSEVLLFESQ